jgi:hypothetical protein
MNNHSDLLNSETRHDLPNWLFDIEDEDRDESNQKSLLEELEIDPRHIYRYFNNRSSKSIIICLSF